MEEQLVNYETAKLACKLGFTEKCENAFGTDFLHTRNVDTSVVIREFGPSEETNIPTGGNLVHSVPTYRTFINHRSQPHMVARPTQSLLQRWLREIHNIHISIEYGDDVLLYGYSLTNIKTNTILTDGYVFKSGLNTDGYSYEEALEESLKQSLTLIHI
jgi:hypothetical protein